MSLNCYTLYLLISSLIFPSILAVGEELYLPHPDQRPARYFRKHWCYGKDDLCNEPTWKGICKTGEYQSPINIPSNYAKTNKNKGYFDPIIIFPRSAFIIQGYFMEFTGKTLKIWPAHDEDNERLTFNWSNHKENTKYMFHNVHFHWGSVNRLGSEHTLDGRSYSGEIHITFYDRKWGTMENALTSKYRNSILVIAVFMTIAPSGISDEEDKITNRFLEHVVQSLGELERSAMYAESLGWLNLAEVFVGTQAYTYLGSLTTPMCNENVIWVVMRNAVAVPENHLKAFRDTNFIGTGQFANNFR